MKIREGQTIWDLIIQTTGDVNRLPDLLTQVDNINIALSGDIDLEAENNSTAEYFKDKIIATEGVEIAGTSVQVPGSNEILNGQIRTHEGQNIWDLAINHNGSIEGLHNLLSYITDINSDITPQYIGYAARQNPVVDYFKKRQYIVVSSLLTAVAPPPPAYSAEALAVFAKMPNPLTDLEKIGIAAFVDQMVLDGNWSKLDYFFGFFLSDIDNACTSWVGTKTATRVNSPTHDSKGFLFNGTTQYIETGIEVSTDIPNMVASFDAGAEMGAYVYSRLTIGFKSIIGYYNMSVGVFYLNQSNADGLSSSYSINDNSVTSAYTLLEKKLYSVKDDVTINIIDLNENGVKVAGGFTGTTGILGTGTIAIGARKRNDTASADQYYSGKISLAYFGGNLANIYSSVSLLESYFSLNI